MEERPLNEIIAETVDDFVLHAEGGFDKEEIVERVLQHPEVQQMRKGYDMHDRSANLENVFLRDVRRKVTQRLRRDGCVAQDIGGKEYRWYPPERADV